METRSTSPSDQMVALLEISEALLSTLELSAVLQIIADSVCRLVDLERSAIFMYDAATNTVRGIAAHQVDAREIQAITELLPNLPLAERAILTRTPVLSPNAPADHAVPDEYVEQFGLRALACAPLIARDQVVGVIFLDQAGRPFRFSRQQRQLLQAFGNLAALALENARLHSAAEEAAVLRDRTRIAQELHDNVAQIFFGIGLEAKASLAQAPSVAARRRLGRIGKLASQGSTEIRNAIFALSSGAKPEGLTPSIEHLVREYRVSTGSAASLLVKSGFPDLPPQTEETLFGAAREALQNAGRHGDATAVTISLGAENGWLSLSVRDKGPGRAADIEEAMLAGAAFGLRSLRERLSAGGGGLRVADNPEGGVTVTFYVPQQEWTAHGLDTSAHSR